jgi:hypothetical protein
MTALPFIFLTTNNHVIPLSTLQNGQQPPSTTISKVFFQPQIEEIKKEFTDVTNMGSATAEEWLKGLEDRGKERKLDASRWERWEGSGGITRMRTERFENRTSSINSNVSTPAITMSLTYGAPVTNGHLHSISGRSSAIQLQPHGLPSIPPVPQSAHPSLRMYNHSSLDAS